MDDTTFGGDDCDSPARIPDACTGGRPLALLDRDSLPRYPGRLNRGGETAGQAARAAHRARRAAKRRAELDLLDWSREWSWEWLSDLAHWCLQPEQVARGLMWTATIVATLAAAIAALTLIIVAFGG